ncbi:hypothetical protein BH11BAC2_BH11BAC2_20230 [soil metagenome]
MKLQRIFLILLGIILLNSSCNAQSNTTEGTTSGGIKWMSFEEAVAKCDKNPKKIFIDVYTGWCGWCKRMDATTFKDSSIINYMTEHYYAVKLDAETKDTIHFKDKIFTYKTESKANELALSLLNGQMSYPSFVFLDEKYQLLSPLQGFNTVEQITPVLRYFGENIYLTKKWEDYQKGLSKTE